MVVVASLLLYVALRSLLMSFERLAYRACVAMLLLRSPGTAITYAATPGWTPVESSNFETKGLRGDDTNTSSQKPVFTF